MFVGKRTGSWSCKRRNNSSSRRSGSSKAGERSWSSEKITPSNELFPV